MRGEGSKIKRNGMTRFIPVLAVSIFVLITVLVSVFPGRATPASEEPADVVYMPLDEAEYKLGAKRDLLCLLIAYPEHITGFERTEEGGILVVMKSGNKIVYDDRKLKSYEQKLSYADLQDAMEQIYPSGALKSIPPKNTDPGRIRCYEFLSEVYGGTRKIIERNLVSVKTGRKNVSFNKNNGAAIALEDAFSDVNRLIGADEDIRGFVFPMSGTFNYRVIAGTDRLSPHAFGIAIDLKSDPCDYWRWASEEQGRKRLAEYPPELVRAFEEHGFIWGGKWNRFDFLHYEYRPELIIKARASADLEKQNADPWYNGFPEDSVTPDLIETVAWIFG